MIGEVPLISGQVGCSMTYAIHHSRLIYPETCPFEKSVFKCYRKFAKDLMPCKFWNYYACLKKNLKESQIVSKLSFLFVSKTLLPGFLFYLLEIQNRQVKIWNSQFEIFFKNSNFLVFLLRSTFRSFEHGTTLFVSAFKCNLRLETAFLNWEPHVFLRPQRLLFFLREWT